MPTSKPLALADLGYSKEQIASLQNSGSNTSVTVISGYAGTLKSPSQAKVVREAALKAKRKRREARHQK